MYSFIKTFTALSKWNPCQFPCPKHERVNAKNLVKYFLSSYLHLAKDRKLKELNKRTKQKQDDP